MNHEEMGMMQTVEVYDDTKPDEKAEGTKPSPRRQEGRSLFPTNSATAAKARR